MIEKCIGFCIEKEGMREEKAEELRIDVYAGPRGVCVHCSVE